jgi:hypothetical protein
VAAEIAPIGHGDPKASQRAAEGIDDRHASNYRRLNGRRLNRTGVC